LACLFAAIARLASAFPPSCSGRITMRARDICEGDAFQKAVSGRNFKTKAWSAVYAAACQLHQTDRTPRAFYKLLGEVDGDLTMTPATWKSAAATLTPFL
jgi:transcription initiation factor TFIIIB Brf1 subunit/transcription initiation factor TFIIB